MRLSVGELRDDRDAPLFIGTLHDLTEVLRARERIEELQSELMQVARASAVGEMGATLAHELTQPLSAVAGFVEASAALIDQGDGRIPASVRAYMDQAVAQAQRMGAVVRRLRDFTSRGDTERSVEDVNAVVEEICELATLGTATDGIELEMDLAASLPPVLIDHIQIQQVVLNLVRNSIEALNECRDRHHHRCDGPQGPHGRGGSQRQRPRTAAGSPRASVRALRFDETRRHRHRPEHLPHDCRGPRGQNHGRCRYRRRGTGFRFSVPVFDEPSVRDDR